MEKQKQQLTRLRQEKQDIEHLIKLADACLDVDWENLPTFRNPAVYEEKSYTKSYTSPYSTYGSGSYDRSYSPSRGKSWSRSGSVKKTYSDYDDF